MLELIGIAIVCLTVLVGLWSVLRYFKAYRIERSSWLEAIRAELLSMVNERLGQQANYQKDLETVNANQLKLAQELELIKKTQQIKTSFQRPPGSIV